MIAAQVIRPTLRRQELIEMSSNNSGSDSPETACEAAHVYLLMKQDYRISRNVRAQWFFDHLNKTFTVDHSKTCLEDFQDELEVLAVVPKDSTKSCHGAFKLVPNTAVTLLARRYRLVFCLDLSPSVAAVDVRNEVVLIEEIFVTLRECLEKLTRHFQIPGSSLCFCPQLYVTIIAQTSLPSSEFHQVLIQGWLLTNKNLEKLMDLVQGQLVALEDYLAAYMSKVINKANGFGNGAFNLGRAKLAVSTPEASFVNMLRYGILAMQLLPENTSAGIIIITDGMIGISDIHLLESVLSQLRNSTISCSFLQIGSSFYPQSCLGLVPYIDLMQFIAMATYGAYLPSTRDVDASLSAECNDMNVYHRALLAWSFQWGPYSLKVRQQPTCNLAFVPNSDLPMERKKQLESHVPASLCSVLSCRLREGFGIKYVQFKDSSRIEVSLVLPWKHGVNFEYIVTSAWPVDANQSCHVVLMIEGNYDFLHDLTCPTKKPFKSVSRSNVVKKFLGTLQNLSQTDKLLVHLHSFANNSAYYQIPESVRSGVPLFYLPGNATNPVLYSSDFPHLQFASFWELVCMLDINIWQKWMHTHRFGILLLHDQPLPKHLHLPNSNGRYNTVQCRQALLALNTFLKDWSSFVLVENHSYIKFMLKEPDKPPISFYIIRVTSKAPCMVIRLAFLGGTPSRQRNEVVRELQQKILALTIVQRSATPRDGPSNQKVSAAKETENVDQRMRTKVACCVLLQKSVEKILIRYEKAPLDFWSPVQDLERLTHSSTPSINGHQKAVGLYTTLESYLYHQRWIWSVRSSRVAALSIQAVGRILNTLVRMRLQEGYWFAHSYSGIVNLVLEIQMKHCEPSKDPEATCDLYPCVLQYVIFPPHSVATNIRESLSDDEGDVDDMETDGDLHLIVECWIEPQCGFVQSDAPEQQFLNGLGSKQLAQAMFPVDCECISTMITLEHICTLCQNKLISLPECEKCEENDSHGTISYIPFAFDIMRLFPKSRQCEMLFSTLTDGSDAKFDGLPIADVAPTQNQLLLELLHKYLALAHDREMEFKPHENVQFMNLVCNRIRDYSEHPLPFNFTNLKHKDNLDVDIDESCSSSWPMWKCYVKGISVTHAVITVLPSTYRDIQSLNFNIKPRQCTVFTMPIYVYDCTLTDVINQLVFKESNHLPDDIFMNFEFQAGSDFGDDTISLKNETLSSEKAGDADRSRSPSPPQLKQHCSVVEQIFFHCFVVSIFRSLQARLPVDRHEVQKAIDGVCEESLMEIDISAFLKTVCSHARDCYKYAGVESCLEIAGRKTDSDTSNEDVVILPLNLLSRGCHCNQGPGRHDLDDVIQEKFQRILRKEFAPIPSLPEFYFYCPDTIKNIRLESESDMMKCMDGAFVVDDSIDMSLSAHADLISEERSQISLDSRHDPKPKWSADIEDSEISSICSAFGDISQCEFLNVDEIPPLFIHLTCSVKYKNNMGSSSVVSLPTCIREVIGCLENQEMAVDLSSLQVTLDVICLTLPDEGSGAVPVKSQGMRSTSFCSSSPVPHDMAFGSPDLSSDHSSLSNGYTEESIANQLKHLPEQQHRAVLFVVEELKWMLQDEIVSSMREVTSVFENVLNMVAVHVQGSSGRSGCLATDVPLQFVCGSKQSHEKFTEEFGCMSLLPGYQIFQKGCFYYVSHSENSLSLDASVDTVKMGDSHCKDNDGELLKEEIHNDLSTDSCASEIKSQLLETDCVTDDNSEIGELKIEAGSSDLIGIGEEHNICSSSLKDILPHFWLVMKVQSDHVSIFFHSREHSYFLGKEVYQQVVLNIKNACKLVNQMLLLQDLYNTHLCNQLLEPESNEDIWKYDDMEDSVSRRPSIHWQNSCDDSDADYQNNYLEANMKFRPGAFSCSKVWETSFVLHPRLKTGPSTRSGALRGIQALRTVLLSLSVNNRTNMFVYRESNTSAVFYLRLHESQQVSQPSSFDAHGSKVAGKSEEEALSASRSSSVLSLSTGKGQPEQIDDDLPRPRVNSLPEKDRDLYQDALSITSRTSSVRYKAENYVNLSVHGICEAGPDIKEHLVQALQKRLDDAVLDVISVTLSRNPACKLTPEDVQFIQRYHELPKRTVQFTIPVQMLPFLHSVGHYFRQGLRLWLLHSPKYTDNSIDYHFKAYVQNKDEHVAPGGHNVFLYNSPQEAGNKGIACVVLSLVDGQGNPVHHYGYTTLCPSAYKDGLSPLDFEILTSTVLYSSTSLKSPGPMALAQLQIWEKGKVDTDRLVERLSNTLQHALWDAVTEYKLLTAPLAEMPCDDTRNACSEPSTPIKGMNMALAHDAHTWLEKLRLPLVRDLEVHVAMDAEYQQRQEKYEIGEKGPLHFIYTNTVPMWLEFSKQLGVPSVQKHTWMLLSRHAVEFVLREIHSIILGLLPDTLPKIFKQMQGGDESKCFPFHLNLMGREKNKLLSFEMDHHKFWTKNVPGQSDNYFLIGRNLRQWQECTGRVEEDATKSLIFKNYKDVQKFPPEECFQGPNSTQLVAQCSETMPELIPRQRMILIVVRDKHFTVYIYNWAVDIATKFMRDVNGLFEWHNSRCTLLHSIAAQKLGLFLNQPAARQNLSPRQPLFPLASVDLSQLVKSSSPVKLELRKQMPVSPGVSNTQSAPSTTSEAKSLPPFLDSLRDVSSSTLNSGSNDSPCGSPSRNLMKYHGHQLLRIMDAENNDLRRHLCRTWQNRDPQTRIPIAILRQFSRMEHFVFTPLLLHPKWRLQVAAARDHTVHCAPPSLTPTVSSESPDLNRIRHTSDSSFKGMDTQRAQSTTTSQQPVSLTPPKSLFDELWHANICAAYVNEFIQYLQTLGFVPLQLHSSTKWRQWCAKDAVANVSGENTRGSTHAIQYMQKFPLGGILVLELAIFEPYFSIVLYALKNLRLHPLRNRTLNSQFTVAFLDEIDKIKVLMHLHSFTYDYHLRSIHSYLCGQHLAIHPGYHVVSFLEDFIKYYQKSPNFARNLVYTGSALIEKTTTPALQLYEYLLNHNKQYKMKVLKMVCSDLDCELENEYALAQVTTKDVFYRDGNDMKQTDEFDVTLVVSHSCNSTDHRANAMTLKFCIILTRRRELYPKPALDRQPGTFRTVLTTIPARTLLAESSMSDCSSIATIRNNSSSFLYGGSLHLESSLGVWDNSCEGPVGLEPDAEPTTLTGIRQESVNYMGFFSTHEEMMHNIMLKQADDAMCNIKQIVAQSMVHCRRDSLWQRLLSCGVREFDDHRKRKEESLTKDNGLSFVEFAELLKMVSRQSLSVIDRSLAPFLEMPVTWYQGLVKVMATKYTTETYRHFISNDGNTQFVVILGHNILDSFMMMSLDLHTSSAELNAVYRDVDANDKGQSYTMTSGVQSLIEGFVDACCFHLWSCIM